MRIAALSGWTREQIHVVTASFLGWSLDAFDFFLLVFVLKDIAQEFGTEISDVTVAILVDPGDAADRRVHLRACRGSLGASSDLDGECFPLFDHRVRVG